MAFMDEDFIPLPLDDRSKEQLEDDELMGPNAFEGDGEVRRLSSWMEGDAGPGLSAGVAFPAPEDDMSAGAWSSEPGVLADVVQLQKPLRFRREPTELDQLLKPQVKARKTAKAKAKAKIVNRDAKLKMKQRKAVISQMADGLSKKQLLQVCQSQEVVEEALSTSQVARGNTKGYIYIYIVWVWLFLLFIILSRSA